MLSRRHQLQQLMMGRWQHQPQPQKIKGISGFSPFHTDSKGDAMDHDQSDVIPAAKRNRQTTASAAPSQSDQEGGCSWSSLSTVIAGLHKVRKVQYLLFLA